ncbi:MAG: MlaD family protein [Candidatus Zixiibacteriota bacterium]
MKKTIGEKWGALKVGLVLVFAIAAMLWASFFGGGTSIFEQKSTFVCYFQNVNGLISGSPVWMAGVEVGNIRSVKFVNLDSVRVVQVTCRIKKSAWPMVTSQARVQLGTIGFLGDKYVEVLPGVVGGPTIADGDVVPTAVSADAASMFEAGREAFDGAGELVSSMDTLLTRLNRGEGTLGQMAVDDQLYSKMTTLMARLSKLTASMQNNQERIVSSIETTAEALSDLSKKVNGNTGTIGKIMNDPALYDNLAATSARFDSILTRINTAEGSLGLLVSDTTLYTDLSNLLVRVGNLVSDIEENPRKYFKLSVF